LKRKEETMTRLTRYAWPTLVLVALAVSGCNSDSESPATEADVTITIVANNGTNSYSPNPANVTAGQTVSWHNADGMTHTATQNGGGFDTGNVANGATSTPIQINTTGDLAYHCSLHPNMAGTLHVTP
jgi:plastocyanin